MNTTKGIPIDECLKEILTGFKLPNSTQRGWKKKYISDELSHANKLRILKKYGYVLVQDAIFKKK